MAELKDPNSLTGTTSTVKEYTSDTGALRCQLIALRSTSPDMW